jgi:aminoglycoside phosphotransferase (APT) family kinase protein
VTPERVYLVDWDTAQQGDPFLDLAQLGVFAFPAPAQRDALLEAYLGRPATAQERGRAIVARALVLGIYAAAFFLVHARLTRAPSRAKGVPLPELFAQFAVARERVEPGLVAASLFAEMHRMTATRAFEVAVAALVGQS